MSIHYTQTWLTSLKRIPCTGIRSILRHQHHFTGHVLKRPLSSSLFFNNLLSRNVFDSISSHWIWNCVETAVICKSIVWLPVAGSETESVIVLWQIIFVHLRVPLCAQRGSLMLSSSAGLMIQYSRLPHRLWNQTNTPTHFCLIQGRATYSPRARCGPREL